MTYRPIDKPTDPGWYWCEDNYNSGPYIVRVMFGDIEVDWNAQGPVVEQGLGVWNERDGGIDPFVSKHTHEAYIRTWYGPAIEPPQLATDGPTQGTVR